MRRLTAPRRAAPVRYAAPVAVHESQKAQPRLIQPARWARNLLVPMASAVTKAARAHNHLLSYRKKVLAYWTTDFTSVDVGAAGTTSRWHGFGRTGLATDRLTAIVYQFPAYNGSAVEPHCIFRAQKTGGTSQDSDKMHAPLSAGGAVLDSPDDVVITAATLTVDPDSEYRVELRAVDYARPIAWVVYEHAPDFLDDADAGVVDPRFSLYEPITTDRLQALLEAATDAWKANGANVMNWSVDDSLFVLQSATYTNLLDLSSTGNPTAITPGWRHQSSKHARAERSVVPCVFAFRGHVGSGQAGDVQLIDTNGTQLATIAVNNTTEQWLTTTFSLTEGEVKFDLQGKVDVDGQDLFARAAAVYEYEA